VGGFVVAGTALGLLLAATLWPATARAHGPSVRVGYSGVRPAMLAIAAGTTVHFQNANSGDGPCTVVADDGSFRSPTLARGEGWHHEFNEPGRHSFHIAEYGGVTGVIVVGKREEGAEPKP